ncbi:endospore germination permease [Paenibacillus sepulcri]|uniref:Endospore germination permease n=1 Tax=Paenibacillus sepulcri TaxID=359917 RepID=A0ABS7CA24_9BACL|nr:endospore germination permease [Paenibacillus sepulcri]
MRPITAVQVAAIVTSSTIGVGVLAVPLLAVRTADTGAPLVTLLGTLVALFGLFLVTVLGIRFPDQSIIQYSEDIIGRGIAFVASLGIVSFFSILMALISREFGEVVITSILKRTPLEVTVLAMLLLAAVFARTDIVTFASIHLFYLPFIMVPGWIIVLLSLKNSRVLNLLPVWGNEHHELFFGILTIAALFQGSFIITMVIPFMKKPKKAYLSMIWGWFMPSFFFVLTVISAVAVFGPEEIKLLMWPTLELAKTTALPANILERLDAAILAVWVTNVFTTLLSIFYLTIKSITQMFHLQNHKMFAFCLLPFIFLIAMLPQSVLQMYEFVEFFGKIGLFITICYPILLLLIAVIRKKRGKPVAVNENGSS